MRIPRRRLPLTVATAPGGLALDATDLRVMHHQVCDDRGPGYGSPPAVEVTGEPTSKDRVDPSMTAGCQGAGRPDGLTARGHLAGAA